jgi:hypothetical protein
MFSSRAISCLDRVLLGRDLDGLHLVGHAEHTPAKSAQVKLPDGLSGGRSIAQPLKLIGQQGVLVLQGGDAVLVPQHGTEDVALSGSALSLVREGLIDPTERGGECPRLVGSP